MPNAFDIRIATLQDAAAVTDLLRASYTILMASSYDPTALAEILPHVTNANQKLLSSGTFYIADGENGQVVGCGGWTFERPGGGEFEPGLVHVRHFGTHPEWSGRGIGRAIFEQCLADARAADAQRFECYSSLNAEPFYAALGFVRVRLVNIPVATGLELPSVIMARQIRR